MNKRNFDYEANHLQIKNTIHKLKASATEMQLDLETEIEAVMIKLDELKKQKYKNLTPWEKTLLSRHPDRPGSKDFIEHLCENWVELHGDRLFGDDAAIIGGIGSLEDKPVTFIGHRKGKDTRDNIRFNFGMPHPEGYRKVQRLLLQAEKFKRPVITFIDTPGAYPGMAAEERGQASAIARTLMALTGLRTPIVSIVIGQGGSGGALALAVADRTLMLSNAVFSVASPEACASIMWKSLDKVEEMANTMKITAQDLLHLQIIDEIIEEPPGGAHLDPAKCYQGINSTVKKHLDEIVQLPVNELLRIRQERLRNIGCFTSLLCTD
ncbi:MAG: acetyl-CoA carboxylase carboxyltransferase subunit alpha [Bacillota bacterium]|nr:acetyl-CoA carboxylase carboxyltransferase subunit alpha [Bacillota bacterium]